ncbi:MAG: hypothetical protein HRU17_17650 [Polyangiaceae bacterium]|nr:hypothetical protein [Polyangiaceae bacterium]
MLRDSLFVVPLVALAASVVSATAVAGPLLELIGGSHGSAGLSARTTGASSSSAYFNPALLPTAEEEMTAGFFALRQEYDIHVAPRRGNEDVPGGAPGENATNTISPDQPLVPFPTVWLEQGRDDMPGFQLEPRPRNAQSFSDFTTEEGGECGPRTTCLFSVGLVREIFDEHLVLGFYGLFPMGHFQQARAFFNDEREQFFSNSLHPELYGDRLGSAEISFGMGSQVLPYLSVGVAFSTNVTNTGPTNTFVADESDLSKTQLDLEVNADSPMAPHFAVVYDATERIRFTGTFHSVQKVEISSDASNVLSEGSTNETTVEYLFGYLPWSASVGTEYSLLEGGEDDTSVSVTANAQYKHWADYRNRHNEAPLEAWSNTIDPTLGVRFGLASWKTHIDLAYVSSPVPTQVGRTNYVDNDRMSAGFGVSCDFYLLGSLFRAGGQLQVHALPKRTHVKTTPPPTPTEAERSLPDGMNLADMPLFSSSYEPDYRYSNPQLVVDEIHDAARVNSSSGEPFVGREGLQTNNPGWPGFDSTAWMLGGGLHLSLLY